MNRKSKNTVKNRWDFVGIFTCACDCVCVRARARAYVFVWVIVAYYRVYMCEWYIVHVYMKVHAQRVVITGC